jgi:soluble lytic murein transglycosylase-like protein
MQLMPDTARQYGVKNVFDPEDNIEGGIKYLKDLTKLYENEKNPITLILAAYNAGQEAVKKYGGKIPDYPETRAYIKQVMDTYALLPQKRPTRIITFYDSEGRLQVTNDLNKAALLRGRQN